MKQYSKFALLQLGLVALIIQLTATTFVVAQTKTDKIKELMNLYAEYGQFNGSVLVSENGNVIYKEGLGFANMEWGIPNQPSTKHRLGSITKQFTSMVIMQLVEQGKLDLDGMVTTYLPNYSKKNGDKITIHHLLTHSSGIPNYTSIPNFFKDKSRDTYQPEEFLKFFEDLSLDFKPGKEYAYSNSGYFLLGVIIEKVMGASYEEALQENIFTPLNMVNSGFDHYSTILKNRSSGYEKNGNTSYVNARYLDMSVPFSAGSIYSTVEDLFLWDQSLYTDQLLSAKYTELMFTPQMPAFRGSYGYGWMILEEPVGKNNEKIKIYSHSGGINGYNTLITRFPFDNSMVVLLSNTGRAALEEMTLAITAILYDRPYAMPKKSLANTLIATYMEQGLDPALEQFSKLKNSDEYAIKENEMNNIGYQLLQLGKVKEAIEVFKLNVQAFPESGNTYDSLGEAYLISGDNEKALVNYKKSVEIDPQNINGARIIKKLESGK